MGTNNLTGLNIEFPIYNSDGSSFYGLVLRRATFDSVVMSLGDKITGDVVYINNALPVSMGEYIVFAGVKYTLVNPPTVVREGLAQDNSDLKGMTKYSFEFYHPMYQLGNLPFSDVAVSLDQQRYLSENKVFSWIGKPDDYIAKLNKNLANTQWIVVKSDEFPVEKINVLSDVLSFDKATIADALKTWYDTWKIPYVVDAIDESDPLYAQGKRFKVVMGLPSNEILDSDDNPYIFEMGQGVGLKNNSRTPKNNKIVTRIAPYGSERNIPYGYPQIVWTGNQDWDYTIDNDPTAANSYPIYDGIVGGQNVRLIKHPFTRKTLMPSIYATLVNKKVNPNATGYDPTIELVDYYDATSEEHYPNPINPLAPSYEAHEFSDIYPRLDEKSILGAEPYDTLEEQGVDGYLNEREFLGTVLNNSTSTKNSQERTALLGLYNALNSGSATYHAESQSGDDYQFVCDVTSDDDFYYVKYTSSNINYDVVLLKTGHTVPVASSWNDKMDDEGNYVQSYFKITLPLLNFDMYACASITEEMKIYMRSGACIGCTFNVAVDWDDYKKNFYDENGNFAPNGSQRDLTKYPKTNSESVTLIVQKDNETFGTLMPNIYQQPTTGDEFVVLGISLPTSYIADAEQELDDAAKQYMLENNVYYYEYPLKFDEHFLAKNTDILEQIKPNSIVRFKYNGEQDNIVLYVKQMTVKYGQGVLPQYDITVTDDIEVVLNKIGQVTDDVSRMRFDIARLMQLYTEGVNIDAINRLISEKLSKIEDDTAQGFISFMQGIQVGERFVSGILGEGGVFRRNADGKVYLETDNLYVRMKAYFDTVEVRHYKHSAGNRIASNAGIHCSRVVWIDASGNQTEDIDSAVKFRCYFRATDGEDTVANYFVAASNGTQDLAFCDKTTVESGVNNRRYWRAVVGKNAVLTDDGEAWIDLSKSDCESGSDIPMAGDDIIQLGNKTDTERQGAIIEYVNGNDAPSYHIYQFINSYSLENKNIIRIGFNSSTGRAEMNVYGDAYIGDPNGSTYVKYNQATKKLEIKAEVSIQSTFGGHTLEEKVVEYAPEYDDSWIQPALDGLQDQIDGAIETYYMEGVPSLNLPPVVSTQQHPYDEPWLDGTETAEERTKILNNHVGDLYYDKSTGHGYRFLYDDSSRSFGWARLTDEDIEAALEAANNAQATADGKMTIYSVWNAWVKNGVNTLQVGDLFIPANDITPTQGGVTYKARKVYKCTTAGQNSFVEIHYTDDSALINFINNTYSSDKTNILQQIDSKAETWYQPSNPANNWSEAEKPSHKGDIWHNTSNTTIGGVGAGLDAIWSGSEWVVSDVPQSVYDKIDGKATIYGNASSNPPTGYHKNDLWILATDYGTTYKAGTILSAQNNYVNAFYWNDWKEDVKYTKDLKDFINNTYSTDITNLESQIDGKAETWWQNNNPADSWTDNTTKAKHVGDLWMDTSSNGGNKTYIYVDKGAGANPRYMWEEQNVPTEVFNKIEGKAQIFVLQPTPPYNVGDLWVQGKNGEILKCKTTRTSGSYSDEDWTWASKYTDDSKFNGYINQVLNGTGSSGDAATVANAIRVIKGALNEATVIDGGLVLTSLINLRSNNKTWAGISGQYDERTEEQGGAKGHGIAAWYGGSMVDHEFSPSVPDYAKSLFRFDGSGYLAGGNITWDKNGNASIKGELDARIANIGGWLIAPRINASLGVPAIEGYNKDGVLVLSLLFDGDESSGSSPYYGNGLYMYGSDGLPISKYARKSWEINHKNTSDNIWSYMVASVDDDLSMIRGIYQSNQQYYFDIGVDSKGIILQAQKWPALNELIEPDDWHRVFVDGYGLVRVKGVNDSFVPQGSSQAIVTSVGLSAPTGFQVSNSPITTSGNIVLSFASGYSLPTTAKQNNWDTAYGWGNHANAGYATQSWVTTQLANYLPLTGGYINGNLDIGNRLSISAEGGTPEDPESYDFYLEDGVINIDYRTVIDRYSVTSDSFIKNGGTSSQFLKADGSVDSNTYLPKQGNSFYFITDADMPETAANISTLNAAHRMTLYRNAILMPYQMDNANDGGFIRSRGTSESSAIFEIGMWDDSGAGETIQFNYYPTTSTINPTYSISVPKKTGTIALTSDLASYNPTTNFKTINGNSIIGTGNINIEGGGGGGIVEADYTLINYTYILPDSGQQTAYDGWSSTDFVDVSGFSHIRGNIVSTYGAFYDSSKTYISGFSISTSFTSIPSNAHYIRTSAATTSMNSLVIELLLAISEDDWGELSYNTVPNTYISYNNGSEIAYGGWSSTDYIDVSNCCFLKTNIGISMYNAWYDSNKNFIGSFSATANTQFGIPRNAAYCRLSSTSADISGLVVLGASPSGSSYLPLTGGTITGNLTVNGTLTASNGDLDIWSAGNQGGRGTIFDFKQHQDVYFNSAGEYFFYAALNAPAFNNTSDLRKKTITGDVPMNLYNVANAPLFKFTWKDEKKYSGQHIGSAAQYWQTVLPELVSIGRDADMTLAMQYDVIALASAITVAKTVVNHEERIKVLENENKSLKEEIELLKNKS